MKLLKWLSIADRFTKKYLDQQLAPFGINSSQHMYLLKICDHPGILQDSLINSFYVHPSNIVRMIATLEKNEFLIRVPCENDKRTCLLYPTQKALDMVEQVRTICNEVEKMLTNGLSDEELSTFNHALVHVGKQMAKKSNVTRVEDEFDE